MMQLYKNSQFIFWILGFYIFSLPLASCFQNNKTISSENIKKLKSKYDIETINYFYETVFHEDFSKEKRDYIFKWNSNPKIVILGDPSTDEIRYVNKAISEINKLNLPIKCALGNSSDSSSIDIFFGEFKEVCTFLDYDSLSISETDTSRSFGQGKSIGYDGIISKAYIGIYYAEKDLNVATRYNVVLEEIIQSLGVIGDSYTYPGSLFFENDNPAKSLTPLDINVLSLLYEPVIPANYTRRSFEKKFSNELYTVNTSEKIIKLLERYPQVSYNDVEKSFIGGLLLKHPKETNIYLYGSTQKEDLVTIEHAILSINKISPNITLKLSPPTPIEPTHGIVLDFRQLSQQKEPIKGSNEMKAGKTCMFQKLIKNKVVLSFNTNESNKELRQRSIVDLLYLSLVPIPQERSSTNKLFEVKDSRIDFSPRYANLLKLIYSNEFIDGLKLSDFMKIKTDMVK